MKNTSADLLRHFDAVPDFPEKGILFQDFSRLLREHLSECVDAMVDCYPKETWADIDYLLGIESRGFILATALATHLNKGLVLARKAGKLPNVSGQESYDLEYGTATLEMQSGTGNVMLVDDVLATGGTLSAAYKLCHKVGYQPLGALVLMDLNLSKPATFNDRYKAVIEL